MVNVLIGNKDTQEISILCQNLTNDKSFRIKNVATGTDIISTYWKVNPDILILDNNLTDMSIKDIVNRLSCNPVEQKRCNTILTLTPNYIMDLKNFTKINTIFYKPINNNELIDKIKFMALDFNTRDLEVGEIDWLLQSLNINYISPGYRFMKDAITYCYYRPDELEFLTTVLQYLAYKYNVPISRVRDSLKSCIRPFNNTNDLNIPDNLHTALYNKGHPLSLKRFIEKIVFYLIKEKKKGRLF